MTVAAPGETERWRSGQERAELEHRAALSELQDPVRRPNLAPRRRDDIIHTPNATPHPDAGHGSVPNAP